MKNKRFCKILSVLVFFGLALAKKKDKIIIVGGSSSPSPYMPSSSSPQIIPFPIPIFLPMQQQPAIPPPVYLPQPLGHIGAHQPTTQHIYHHHQNGLPQIHFIQLPVYKQEYYGHSSEMSQYANPINSDQYQSSEHHPIYLDYSYGYKTSPSVRRRNGLKYKSILSLNHSTDNNNNQKFSNYLNTEKQIQKKQKTNQKKSKVDSNNKSACDSNCKQNILKDYSNIKKSNELNHYVKYDDQIDFVNYDGYDFKENDVKKGKHESIKKTNHQIERDNKYSD